MRMFGLVITNYQEVKYIELQSVKSVSSLPAQSTIIGCPKKHRVDKTPSGGIRTAQEIALLDPIYQKTIYTFSLTLPLIIFS